MQEQDNFKYCGFMKRALSALLDGVVLTLAYILAFMFLTSIISGLSPVPNPDTSMQLMVLATHKWLGALFFIIFSMIPWVYYTVLESSDLQGTLGKAILKIKIYDADGKKLSFFKANLRFFAKIISVFILYIGYFMVIFTQKKQALHDKIVNCFLIIND